MVSAGPAAGGSSRARRRWRGGQPSAAPRDNPPTGTRGQPRGGSTGQAAPVARGQRREPAPRGDPSSGAAGQPAGGGAGPAVGGAAGATAPAATSAAATIVPLYTSPGDASWNTVIAAKMAHPKVGVVAIVNPNNGPGSAVDSCLRERHRPPHRRRHQGHRLRLDRTTRANSAATVKADIDRWQRVLSWSAHRHLLRRAVEPGRRRRLLSRPVAIREVAGAVVHGRQSRHRHRRGLRRRAGHDADLRERRASRRCTALRRVAREPRAVELRHHPVRGDADATFVRDARKYVQYIYVQSDNLPNPWDSVPQLLRRPAGGAGVTEAGSLRQPHSRAARSELASCCPWALRRRTGTRTCAPGSRSARAAARVSSMNCTPMPGLMLS